MMSRQTFFVILIISVLLFCSSSFSSPPVGWRLIGLFLGPMLLAGAIAAFEIHRDEFREEESIVLVKANSQQGPDKVDIHVER